MAQPEITACGNSAESKLPLPQLQKECPAHSLTCPNSPSSPGNAPNWSSFLVFSPLSPLTAAAKALPPGHSLLAVSLPKISPNPLLVQGKCSLRIQGNSWMSTKLNPQTDLQMGKQKRETKNTEVKQLPRWGDRGPPQPPHGTEKPKATKPPLTHPTTHTVL